MELSVTSTWRSQTYVGIDRIFPPCFVVFLFGKSHPIVENMVCLLLGWISIGAHRSMIFLFPWDTDSFPGTNHFPPPPPKKTQSIKGIKDPAPFWIFTLPLLGGSISWWRPWSSACCRVYSWPCTPKEHVSCWMDTDGPISILGTSKRHATCFPILQWINQ